MQALAAVSVCMNIRRKAVNRYLKMERKKRREMSERGRGKKQNRKENGQSERRKQNGRIRK